jgi:hypothetical protein
VDNDPVIHSTHGWPGLLGGPLDWGVFTTPQRMPTTAGCSGRAARSSVEAVH